MENTLTSQEEYIERFIARNVLVSLFFLLVFSGAGAQAINGDGKCLKKTYHLNSYFSVEVYSQLNVYLTADTGAIVIEADSNIIPCIQLKAEKGTLVIKNDPGIWFNPKTVIKVSIPAEEVRTIKNIGSADINTLNVKLTGPLVRIVNIGSGKVKAALDCIDLKVTGKGSADFDLSGKTQHVAIDMSGSGDIHAQELSAKEANLRLNGSCNAWVNCLDKLNVHIPLISSSTVYYKGSPLIKKTGLGGSTEKI